MADRIAGKVTSFEQATGSGVIISSDGTIYAASRNQALPVPHLVLAVDNEVTFLEGTSPMVGIPKNALDIRSKA